MSIEITEEQKEELLRALKSQRIRLLALISGVRNLAAKKEFEARKKVVDSVIEKLNKQP